MTSAKRIMNNQTWLWQLVVIALLAASQAKVRLVRQLRQLKLKQFVFQQRPFTIQIKNFTCWPTEPSLFTDLSCSSSKKRGAATMSARFSLSQALEQFSLMVDFDIIKKDNSKMNIQHTKIDGCQYLTSACKHKFQGGIFETVLKVSNLPRGCPFQAVSDVKLISLILLSYTFCTEQSLRGTQLHNYAGKNPHGFAFFNIPRQN